MKVFLSWSGENSKRAATVLHSWLPTVIQTVRPYMSAESIEKGERWSVDIAKQLEETHFGVICVTHENKDAPWILFEAGALSKSIERSRVSPLAFGIGASQFTGSPLLQFQFTLFKKDDFKRLLTSMNAAAPEPERLLTDVLSRSFERAWGELENDIAKIDFAHAATDIERSSQPAKLEGVLDELLDIARSQLKVLKSPEELLPPDYLRESLNRADRRLPRGFLSELEGTLESFRSIMAAPLAEELPAQQRDMARLALRNLRLAINFLADRYGPEEEYIIRTKRFRAAAARQMSDIPDIDEPPVSS